MNSPLKLNLRTTEVTGGVVPTEHALIAELKIESGVCNIQTGRRAEFKPVGSGMGAFFARGEAADAADVVPGHQRKRTCLEARGHVAVFRLKFADPPLRSV